MVKRVHLFYAASVVLHGGMALAVGTLHVHEPSRPITITIASAPPPRPVAPSLPPPPPKAPEPAPVPKAAPVVHKVAMAPKAPPRAAPPAAPPPPRAAPPPVPSAAPPDFGVALGNGTGPGGIAVPTGDPGGVPGGSTRHVEPKVLSGGPPRAHDDCADPPAKPKPLQVSQPAYPQEARAAGVQGKVRVELTVDSSGAVASVRLVEGLGHGLDEAALEAAKGFRFEPAQRCGKAVAATFTIAIRFTL